MSARSIFARPARLAAIAPYLVLHRSQHGSYAGTVAALPAHAALDAAAVVAMLRGSVAFRTVPP